MAEANNQEDQENKEVQEDQDKAPTAEDIAAVKAQLEEEQKAKTALEEAMAEKDAKLAELEAALSEAKQGSEASATELASVKEARDEAVSKYLGMAKASNPQVPQDIISGETIAEIDASVEKGKGLVSAVKKTLESETAAAKVPAGAPTRGETTEGMSNKEMIAAGLRQKGGTS
jgi:DNA repair exonuclease SbcCD ATPase subunit